MYLVRFVVGQEDASVISVCTISSLYQPKPANTPSHHNDRCSSLPASTSTKEQHIGEIKTRYPASVSIDTLLKAGKLVKPADKRKETLTFETFDVANQKWSDAFEAVCYIETKEFSSGGFRKAHHETFANNAPHGVGRRWVVKLYNDKAIATITETMQSNIESHCRKQVQMHAVARHITQRFKMNIPSDFGECFEFNRCYYTTVNDQPATIEEYVPGAFVKIINNNGVIIPISDDESSVELLHKAESLVHYTYESSSKKFMLLDIQGMGYRLIDPEIATTEVMDQDTNEVFFCCSNCSTVGIDTFIAGHKCNKLCTMMGLPENTMYIED